MATAPAATTGSSAPAATTGSSAPAAAAVGYSIIGVAAATTAAAVTLF